jgi:hypothetical protein
MKKFHLKLSIAQIKDLTIIFTCFATVIGIATAVFQLRDTWRQEKFVGLSQARDVIDKEDTIHQEIAEFMLSTNHLSPQMLLAKYGSGRAIYYSDEMNEYQKICHHYEEVGALIQAGYIDFDLYYQIEVFPDYFWERTTDLRQLIRDNWDGKARPLPDFLKNFERLHRQYQKRRSEEE